MSERCREPEFNIHHDIWTRRDCKKLGKSAIWLRDQHDLKPKLEVQTHQELHLRTLPFSLSREFYGQARQEWYNNGDHLDAVDRFIELIDRYENDPETAEFAIEALKSQIQFIDFGLLKNKGE